MPFVVIEGLDGAGKSTQVGMLVEALGGATVEYLHFPRFDAPVYGEAIARFLRGEMGALGDVDPYLVALLFAGDRAQAAPMIRGWLDEGKWVVTDRYVGSNVAYQCAKTHDPRALVDWILRLEYEVNDIPRPDASIFLDVPLGVIAERLKASREGSDRGYLKGGEDIHEASMDFQRRVRDAYLAIPGLQVVDCGDGNGGMVSPEVVFSRIMEVLHAIGL